jgi:hypothetical protein
VVNSLHLQKQVNKHIARKNVGVTIIKSTLKDKMKTYYCKKCGKIICYQTVYYGSGLCASCWQIGRKLTKQHRENIGKAFKGKKRAPFTKEHRKKLSQAMSGKNNGNYINGLSKLPYSTEFTPTLRKFIRERDNFKCQYCGLTQEEHFNKWKKDIEVHHIDYNKFNCEETNLITVCRKCNLNANFNKDYYYAYYTYIMENYK